MQSRIFWIIFIILGLITDVMLPLWWALAATIPVTIVSWWIAYRSHWFDEASNLKGPVAKKR